MFVFVSSKEGSMLKIFLSYSTKDKRHVEKFKAVFEEYYGATAFLAHQDLNVSDQWKKRILKEIDTADVYVAVLTGNFKNSDWTAQEAGIALKRKIKIASLQVTVKPYGFLADHQAGKIKLNHPHEACDAVIRGVIDRKALRVKLINGFTDAFIKSESYDFTNQMTHKLDLLGKFSKSLITKLVTGACQNDQIYDAQKTKYLLFEFVERHKALLVGSLWKKFCLKFKK